MRGPRPLNTAAVAKIAAGLAAGAACVSGWNASPSITQTGTMLLAVTLTLFANTIEPKPITKKVSR